MLIDRVSYYYIYVPSRLLFQSPIETHFISTLAEQVPTVNFAMPNESMTEAPAFDFGSIPSPGAFQSYHEFQKSQQKAKSLLLETLAKLQPGESYPGYAIMILIQGMFNDLSEQEIEGVVDDFLEKLRKHQDKK